MRGVSRPARRIRADLERRRQRTPAVISAASANPILLARIHRGRDYTLPAPAATAASTMQCAQSITRTTPDSTDLRASRPWHGDNGDWVSRLAAVSLR